MPSEIEIDGERFSFIDEQINPVTGKPYPDPIERRAKDGTLEPMMQLYTKDGRRVGNATLHRIAEVRLTPEGLVPVYKVVTDAGVWLTLIHGELLDLFIPGTFILRRLPNPQAYTDRESLDPSAGR